MFGINGSEFLVLLIIGLLVIGLKRLPEYAQKLANIVKELRRMANGAREQLKEETGLDLDEMDWRKYDPRQYDPRRIIRDALLEDEPAVFGNEPAAPGPEQTPRRLEPGKPAPFDTEAT